MSLKRELERPDSWVNQFFKSDFGGVRNFVRHHGPSVKALSLKVPLTDRGQARLVGTAFDYRLRSHLGATFHDSPELTNGILLMELKGSGCGDEVDRVWAELMTQLLDDMPVNNELTVSRASIVLAWLDWGSRSGGLWGDGMRSIAKFIEQHSNGRGYQFLNSVDKDIANEVSALYRIAQGQFPFKGAVCGPSFAGSKFVGGADADLIVEKCLYNIKSSINPRKKFIEDLRRLIGYTLLDWDDEFALEQVGFYYARSGVFMKWPLTKLIAECSSRGQATLRSLRKRFRDVAESACNR